MRSGRAARALSSARSAAAAPSRSAQLIPRLLRGGGGAGRRRCADIRRYGPARAVPCASEDHHPCRAAARPHTSHISLRCPSPQALGTGTAGSPHSKACFAPPKTLQGRSPSAIPSLSNRDRAKHGAASLAAPATATTLVQSLGAVRC
eukprot:scaffold2298_cov388-Prasinococcus_capsulatus_cf.AAC.11